jgi:chemotaxis methyl-accepting protein methylase
LNFESKGGIEQKNQVHKRIQNKNSISKEWGPYFKKITNHNYRFNDEIKNKLKFDKRDKNKN